MRNLLFVVLLVVFAFVGSIYANDQLEGRLIASYTVEGCEKGFASFDSLALEALLDSVIQNELNVTYLVVDGTFDKSKWHNRQNLSRDLYEKWNKDQNMQKGRERRSELLDFWRGQIEIHVGRVYEADHRGGVVHVYKIDLPKPKPDIVFFSNESQGGDDDVVVVVSERRVGRVTSGAIRVEEYVTVVDTFETNEADSFVVSPFSKEDYLFEWISLTNPNALPDVFRHKYSGGGIFLYIGEPDYPVIPPKVTEGKTFTQWFGEKVFVGYDSQYDNPVVSFELPIFGNPDSVGFVFSALTVLGRSRFLGDFNETNQFAAGLSYRPWKTDLRFVLQYGTRQQANIFGDPSNSVTYLNYRTQVSAKQLTVRADYEFLSLRYNFVSGERDERTGENFTVSNLDRNFSNQCFQVFLNARKTYNAISSLFKGGN